MADKQVEIEVIAKTEMSEVEDLENVIDEIKDKTSEELELDTNAEEVAGDFDELGESADEATSSVEELSDSMTGIDGSNAQAAAGDVDDLASSASDAASEMENLQASMDLIEASAMIGVAGELSNLGSQAEGLAQDMNTAAISVGQLSTNVGMAEPQMVNLINHISNATFPQNEAMAYVNALNQMGVSADKLGDSATNMDRINDATGIGYNKVMQLTQGLQAVGISADNLPASFDAIAYAQANVNGGADTLAMVLKRQASTINEYGLNVDQLVVIMQKLSEQGVQGMKMGSELSKVLKATNGDTTALENELGLMPGSLSDASSATGEYAGQLQTLADEEAEHKTIIDQLGAAWEDLSLSLSPVMSPLASIMGVIGDAGSFAVGINGLVQLGNSLRGLSMVSTLAGYFSSFFSLLLANPIILVVVAIVALIAALVWAYYNVDWFREMVDNAWATLVNFANQIWSAVQPAIQFLADLFNQFTSQMGLNTNDWIQAILGFILFIPTLPAQLAIYLMNALANALGFRGNFVQTMSNAAVNAVTGFLSFIASLPGRVGSYLSSVLSRAISFGSNLVSNLTSAASRAASQFINGISGLAGKLQGELNNMLSAVSTWAATLPQKFWDAGVNAVKNFLDALGIHSPGTMQRMLIWEVSEMGRRVPIEGRNVVSNISSLGSDITNSFNPELDTANASVTSSVNGSIGGEGQTVNFYFSDVVVDNDERMQRIVDYVRREISWNNTTAGRTI